MKKITPNTHQAALVLKAQIQQLVLNATKTVFELSLLHRLGLFYADLLQLHYAHLSVVFFIPLQAKCKLLVPWQNARVGLRDA